MHRNCIAALYVWVERVFFYKSKRTGALYSNEELSFYDSKRHYDFLFFISERAKKTGNLF